jgi:hypothetical protein
MQKATRERKKWTAVSFSDDIAPPETGIDSAAFWS